MEQLQTLSFAAFWLLFALNVWYFAKYGLVETSLPVPENRKSSRALLALMIAFVFLLILEKFLGGAGLLNKPETLRAERIMILSQIVFFLAARFFILKNGQSEYNRARLRLLYIKSEHFAPGRILEKSAALKTSKMSLKALKLFDRAISKAKKEKREDGSYDAQVLLNIAIAYSEKGLLLRLMNNLPLAEAALSSSDQIVFNPLGDDIDAREYWSLRSSNLYRHAELKQCQGLIDEAKALYEASLEVDRNHDGDPKNIHHTQCLIKKLEESEEVEA